jgi:hypothetical protein
MTDGTQARLDAREEMVCDRCGNRHSVVWFADDDLWNAVMRGGDRGARDEYSFCCPTCLMQLATERGIASRFAVLSDERFAALAAETTP